MDLRQAGPEQEDAAAAAGPAEPAVPQEPRDGPERSGADASAPAGAPAPAERAAAAGAPEVGERTRAEVEREVAVLLFASPEPLSESRMADLLRVPARLVRETLGDLAQRLAAAGLPFEAREIAGGWQLFTSPEMADTAALLARVRKEEKVSPAALETLAVVAYRQPVTKAEIEAIRGVQVGPILRALSERGLVKVTGRSDQPGHPLLYGTTRKFLDSFGLAGLEELPRDGELLRD